MEECGTLVQRIWPACSDEIVRCAANAGIGEDRNKSVTILQNIFSKYCIEVLPGFVKERPQDQDHAASIQGSSICV